jgi:5-(carboxyamino)imidazole ribonucleotide mutase
MAKAAPLVGIIMGSQSDWETMRRASETLEALGIAHEVKIVSAHRTPQRLYNYARRAKGRGLQVIIAGAGGAAHLPGMTASMTPLPVYGVPIESKALKGMGLSVDRADARRIPSAPGDRRAGAVNAALLGRPVLALNDKKIAKAGCAPCATDRGSGGYPAGRKK